ncbi:MAG: zinc-binding alcohol dehydrogenase [Ardenticatenaceae bacterium]|nr:zinc-binding alcohol dehydrogenase [Ardenticatenaceae bacterium]MCB9443226.1 zinc-binding alcohol dehydrogenase [Ardenticatenaceae bacterium]
MNRASLFFVEPHKVEIRETNLPPLQAGQVLVQTVASAISPGTEMLLYRGQMPMGMAVDETIDALGGEFQYPLKYGYAAVGRVMAVGKNVSADWEGRLVFAFNPHETHFAANPDHLLPVPNGILPETAVFLPNMETAVSFLMDGQPMIGEQVAVFGQGIVGLLTTALLAHAPLASLVTLDRYALRREWSKRLGATAALDPSTVNADEIKMALQGERPYHGADLTLELSGNPQALEQAIEITGYNGRILVGSWYGQKRADLNLGGQFHRSHMQIISSQVSHIAPRWNGRWNKSRRLQMAWQMLAQIQPEQLVTHRTPIEQAAQAYQLLYHSPGTAVQVLLTYD